MEEIEKIVLTSVLTLCLGLGGIFYSKHNSDIKIARLGTEIIHLETERKQIIRENFRLHKDLIDRDNPYGWELYGDSWGEIGYRKESGFSELGCVDSCYTYLREPVN
jgi:hypothetical protein